MLPPETGLIQRIAGPTGGLILAAISSLLIVGWLAAVFFLESVRFVVFNPRGSSGFEMFLALGQFFGALVLVLAALTPGRQAMRWIAAALLVLGLGALDFGYFIPLFAPDAGPNVSLYGSVITRCIAATLLAIGLIPEKAPTLGRSGLFGLIVTGLVFTLMLRLLGDRLPELIHTPNWETIDTTGESRIFPGLSSGYIVLSLICLSLALAAAWGAIRSRKNHALHGWLVFGVILFAGAQLHAVFWPSMYSSILTTTSVLRFGWTVVVIAGAILELHALSRERSFLLRHEQERVHQLEELGALKRDFTSIVAHELGTPLAAIGNLARMISSGMLPDNQIHNAASRIQGEARLLQLLVRDFQESADVERDDFAVLPRRVALKELLDDAYSYAQTVRSEHPTSMEVDETRYVLADPERIGQVIRNLLNNAVRHTPRGTPIRIEATHETDGVRIAVIDSGPGIAPEDRGRILKKFGRGINAGSEGRGLGLYLTQRILEAHGTGLVIESEPGQGSSFSFRLEDAT